MYVATLATGMAGAALDYATGPGTVQYALAQPDGARVSLSMVVIGVASTGGVSVHEWWDKTTSITALFDPPAGLRAGHTIDFEGWMTTLAGGHRAVLCERVAYYLDNLGYVTDAVPPIKGVLEPSVWPSKTWIPVSSAQSGIGVMSGGSIATALEDDKPEPPPISGSSGDPTILPPNPIAEAKRFANGTNLPQPLTGKIVTAGTNQFSGFMYIEEPDRSCGIRVEPVSGTFEVGDKVTVSSGAMSTTADGERFIGGASVSKIGSDAVQPVGLVNRNIGGTALMYEQTMLQQGVYGGYGLNNIGLLVKTWGKITYVDDGLEFIYIDDGSNAKDGLLDGNGDPVVGVRVAVSDLAIGNAIILPAQPGSIVQVVGISSCTTVVVGTESHTARMIRLRSQADVSPVVFYVKTPANGGSDLNDGLSWDTAKATVQAALDTAQYGMEVWVAAGTYTGCITLKNGVGLYGGFSANGGESHREQRDWRTDTTILDAGGTGSVVTCPQQATASTVIDGFTIRNGSAEVGGGINCDDGSPTIAHNTITANTATGGSGEARGGGIYCFGGSPVITDNVIVLNSSNSAASTSVGGGIYCDSCPSARIINNTIVSNTHAYCMGDGGDIYLRDCSPVIANNIIAFNTSGILAYNSAPTLRSNCVYGNDLGGVLADYSGIQPGEGDISSDPLLVDRNHPTDPNYHVLDTSPCIDAGDSSYEIGDRDIDGDSRVIGCGLDIGADETPGCGYALTLSTEPAPIGSEATVAVYVAQRSDCMAAGGYQVSVSAADGTLVRLYNNSGGEYTPASGIGYTGADGYLYAKISRGSAGYADVTVSIETCSTQASKTVTAFLFLPDDAWPMFMHDPQHTGASLGLDSAETPGLTLRWSAAVPTARTDREHWYNHPNPRWSVYGSKIFPHPYIDSSPVHAPGCPVIVGAWADGDYEYTASTGYVVAFDPDATGPNGVQAWRYPATGYIGGVASTPAIFTVGSEKRIVVGCMDGKVHCLNAQTGAFIWSYQTLNRAGTGPGKILASPTVYEGRVYIGNESSRMYCLDAETTNSNGDLKWSHDLPPEAGWNDRTGLSSVAIGNVNGEPAAYVGSDNGHMYCLSTATSPPERIIWDYAGEDGSGVGCVESSPTLYAGNVYVGTSWADTPWEEGRNLIALNAVSRELRWYRDFVHEARATPAAANGHVFIGVDTGNDFYGCNALTGRDYGRLQLIPNHYFVGSAALCSADLAFVGNDNGRFYALRQSDLSNPLSDYRTYGYVCSSPAISYAAELEARWIYVVSRSDNGRGDGKGTLYAFRN